MNDALTQATTPKWRAGRLPRLQLGRSMMLYGAYVQAVNQSRSTVSAFFAVHYVLKCEGDLVTFRRKNRHVAECKADSGRSEAPRRRRGSGRVSEGRDYLGADRLTQPRPMRLSAMTPRPT